MPADIAGTGTLADCTRVAAASRQQLQARTAAEAPPTRRSGHPERDLQGRVLGGAFGAGHRRIDRPVDLALASSCANCCQSSANESLSSSLTQAGRWPAIPLARRARWALNTLVLLQ